MPRSVQSLWWLAATLLPASLLHIGPAFARTPLWSGIEAGMSPDQARGLFFVDARGRIHNFSRRLAIYGFYLRPQEPVDMQLAVSRSTGGICGVDISGEKSADERQALLSQLGVPPYRTFETLLDAPGGASALLSGGKYFRVWRWRKGATDITFQERLKPGFYRVRYRAFDQQGRPLPC